MKHNFLVMGLFGALFCASGAFAIGAGSVATPNSARTVSGTNTASTALRGNQALANAYQTNQRNTYYMLPNQMLILHAEPKFIIAWLIIVAM